jgi:hypothetical protein
MARNPSSGTDIKDVVEQRGYKVRQNGSYYETPVDNTQTHIRWPATDRSLNPRTRNNVLDLLKAAGILTVALAVMGTVGLVMSWIGSL